MNREQRRALAARRKKYPSATYSTTHGIKVNDADMMFRIVYDESKEHQPDDARTLCIYIHHGGHYDAPDWQDDWHNRLKCTFPGPDIKGPFSGMLSQAAELDRDEKPPTNHKGEMFAVDYVNKIKACLPLILEGGQTHGFCEMYIVFRYDMEWGVVRNIPEMVLIWSLYPERNEAEAKRRTLN